MLKKRKQLTFFTIPSEVIGAIQGAFKARSWVRTFIQPLQPGHCDAFFRAGEIEAWGRGVERMFSACRAAGVPAPKLRCEPDGMWLEVAFDLASLKVIRAGQRQTGQVTPEVTEQVTEHVARLVLALGEQTLSLRELMQALGLSHRPNFLMLHSTPRHNITPSALA